jgi:hypothetical protein
MSFVSRFRRQVLAGAPAVLVWALVLAGSPSAQQPAPTYPAADRAWSSADYRDLAELIKSGVPLPALADPFGQAVFERIVSLQNLELSRNKTLPLGSRIEEALTLLDRTKTLLVAYITKAQSGSPYERELARLQVFLMAEASLLLDLVDEFVPTIKRDEKYEVRMEGLAKMRQGIRTIMAGAVESAGETSFYSKASTLVLVQGIETYLPSFRPILTDQDRQDFSRRIGRQRGEATDPEVVAALTKLEEALGRP